MLPSVLWHCWLGGRKDIQPVKNGGMVGGGHWLVRMEWCPAGWLVSASVNLPLHHKVQKFSSGSGSPGWSRKKGHKMVVMVVLEQRKWDKCSRQDQSIISHYFIHDYHWQVMLTIQKYVNFITCASIWLTEYENHQWIITLSNFQHHVMDDHSQSGDECIYQSWWRPGAQDWQSPVASLNAKQLSSAGGLPESLK